MINEDAIRAYLFQQFRDILHMEIRRLGSGVQGFRFLIEMKTSVEINRCRRLLA
jgi:hypothetical protein